MKGGCLEQGRFLAMLRWVRWVEQSESTTNYNTASGFRCVVSVDYDYIR